jgi:hypothetical protein
MQVALVDAQCERDAAQSLRAEMSRLHKRICQPAAGASGVAHQPSIHTLSIIP